MCGIITVVAWLIITPLAIYYLVIANTYGNEYIGILINAKVVSDEHCNYNKYGTTCSTNYYVQEIFKKGNTNNTCFVGRMTTYDYKSDANHFVDKTILGTTRTIWTMYNNPKECYDESIKNYNNAVGYALISGSGLLTFIGIIILWQYYVWEMRI